MPYVEGKFVPKPFRPLTSNLFEVIPPDEAAAGDGPPTPEDWQWWRDLRYATAELLVFIVEQMRKNYDGRVGPAFRPPTVAAMMAKAQEIAVEFFDGQVTKTYVSKQVNRLAKQVGLVIYSTEAGERHNWPMATRELDLDDAMEIVEDAMRGRWDTLTSQAHVSGRSQADV